MYVNYSTFDYVVGVGKRFSFCRTKLKSFRLVQFDSKSKNRMGQKEVNRLVCVQFGSKLNRIDKLINSST